MKHQRKSINSQPHQAHIVNLSHDGKGIAKIAGKTTFIPGALIGEHVEFAYVKKKKDFDEGMLLAIKTASPLRVQPQCRHHATCGGCSLQHMSASDQIQHKQTQLLDLLRRYGRTAPQEVLAPLLGPHWHYRNRARLSVRCVENKVMMGFRKAHDPAHIAPITQCPILNIKVHQDIGYLQELLDSLEDKHSVSHVEVTAADDEVCLIIRHLNALSPHDFNQIYSFGKNHGYSLFLQPEGPESIYCIHPHPQHTLTYKLPEYDLKFMVHPKDFTQINPSLNRLMVSHALTLMQINSSDLVLDLFCGLGNFSLPMATLCSHVIGVEGSEAMVKRAQDNAKLNQLNNLDFFAANLDNPDNVVKIFKKARSSTKLLLDPPRSGALEVVRHIEQLNPEYIVYISCNPITLARDADVLVNQKNYILCQAGVMDMFPHTAHVESIALFKKG